MKAQRKSTRSPYQGSATEQARTRKKVQQLTEFLTHMEPVGYGQELRY